MIKLNLQLFGGRGSGGGRGSKGSGGGAGGQRNTQPSLSRISVSDSEYISLNGVRPSGYGNWAFEIDGTYYFYNTTYAKAKDLAKKQAQTLGITRIRLGT